MYIGRLPSRAVPQPHQLYFYCTLEDSDMYVREFVEIIVADGRLTQKITPMVGGPDELVSAGAAPLATAAEYSYGDSGGAPACAAPRCPSAR